MGFLAGADPTSAELVYETSREQGVKIAVFYEIHFLALLRSNPRLWEVNARLTGRKQQRRQASLLHVVKHIKPMLQGDTNSIYICAFDDYFVKYYVKVFENHIREIFF